MKFADINRRYTEIVAEYMAKGYTINTRSMSGHQGEIAKIDLTDGNEIIRVCLESFYNRGENWLEGIELTVGRCTDDVKPNSSCDADTFWTGHCETVSAEAFFRIGEQRGRREAFYGSEEEAEAAKAIYFQRARNRCRPFGRNEVDITDKALEIAKRIATGRLGARRVRRCDIRVVKSIDRDSTRYIVYYCQKSYRLK